MAQATFAPSYDGFVEYQVDLLICVEFLGRNTTSPYMRIMTGLGSLFVPTSGLRARGFIDFDISGIPISAITKVELKISVPLIQGCDYPTQVDHIDIGKLTKKAVLYDNDDTGNLALLADCGAAEYLSNQNVASASGVSTEYTFDLGAQAVTDIKANSSWFSVSLMLNPETIETATYQYIIASENTGTTYDPKLVITYTPAGRRRIHGG